MNWGRGTEDEHRTLSSVTPGRLPGGDRWSCSGDNETAHRLSCSSSFSDSLFLSDLHVGMDHLLQRRAGAWCCWQRTVLILEQLRDFTSSGFGAYSSFPKCS